MSGSGCGFKTKRENNMLFTACWMSVKLWVSVDLYSFTAIKGQEEAVQPSNKHSGCSIMTPWQLLTIYWHQSRKISQSSYYRTYFTTWKIAKRSFKNVFINVKNDIQVSKYAKGAVHWLVVLFIVLVWAAQFTCSTDFCLFSNIVVLKAPKKPHNVSF